MVRYDDNLETRESPGKGRGIFAKQTTCQGTRDRADVPYLTQIHQRDGTGMFNPGTIWNEVANQHDASPPNVNTGFQLLSKHGGECIRDQGYHRPDDEFPPIRAILDDLGQRNQMAFHAITDIQMGDELTID
ncbi:hypothetical protein P154DRAFT_620925 [Amniculicola lignicola CBS 123094]|uniref:SET domain-containing protein n=1 Tax=Amniculicola lignicola CBS 123094 TaxID=1392246 RepID=A0A6A5WCA6_9PLEO|nr:hypothetical protein P154DRAFT_620925 [Amniculicola lignicola CBS 123094]